MSGKHLSFKQQIEHLLNENIDDYPDAVKWMMSEYQKINPESIKTEYERFVDILEGRKDWHGNPYVPVYKTGEPDNFVAFIKWARNKFSWGLKEAKVECEKYIVRTYPDCCKAKSLRHRGIAG